MAISFQCPQCGRKLKAPDSAAGRSSKCPGCGRAVTCPAPTDEAEPLEMIVETDEVDPYGDLGGAEPYVMTEVQEAPALPGQAQRPCPMCGELIPARATKCQFCGEDFTAAPRKPKKAKGKKAQLRKIAQYQKYLIICIGLVILAYIGVLASGPVFRGGPEAPPPTSISPLFFVFVVVYLVFGIAAWVLSVMLASKVYGTGGAILVFFLQFVPCVNLITLLVVSNKATSMLRDKGIEVGFFGADMSQF
jgi:predicted RNA-binding Zn-ribbon protein involved in translation (DUF1610 family)